MLNLVANGPSGYTINNSLRTRSSASAYLNRTFATPTNQKIWTWSGWVKRGTSGVDQHIFDATSSGSVESAIRFRGDTNALQVFYINSTYQFDLRTTQVFRDFSSWYHIVVAYDSTQATASNRVLIYVNGVQVTSFSTATYPALNATYPINSAIVHNIARSTQNTNYYDGYQAELNFIDGQALTPSSFGSTNATTGVWQPAKYTGTYGTNGFYLNFSNIALTSGSNTGLGKDYSGNGNYWNTNNISVTSGTTYDAMTDVPTLTSTTTANYCVINPLWKGSVVTISNGNLSYSSTGAANSIAYSTFGMSSGKWYAEWTQGTTPAGGAMYVGIALDSINPNHSWLGQNAGEYSYLNGNGFKANAATQTSYGATWTSGDVIGVAFDADAGTLTFYKNGTSQGTAFTGIAAGNYYFANGNNPGSTVTGNWNFGQRAFTGSLPTGYLPLNTYNLPTSTIVKGNKYMDASLWTGDGTSPKAVVSTLNFKPDFVWTKVRSTTYSNTLYDSVRGGGQALFSDTTGAEQSNYTNGYIQSFNTNGWTMVNGGTGGIVLNQNAATYVAWQWQAGAGTTSTNTSGSITSTVSVNATAGFSIVTYTGTGANATVGHGLGIAPAFITVKKRSASGNNWITWHKSLSGAATGGYVYLNLTNAAVATGAWNNTSPTSSVFSLTGSDPDENTNGATYVAYCWAAIPGFSAFGSYTGNGSTDGPMIFTGFLPKFIMIKQSSSAGTSWVMYDSARTTYNVVDKLLLADTSGSEVTTTSLDFLSNGFKLRSTDGSRNSSGATYIYAAFASNPFRNSNAF